MAVSQERAAIAEGLKALREAAGLTQQELSDELGVSRNTVARWEMSSNPTLPDTPNLRGLAKFYSLDIDSFVDRISYKAERARIVDRIKSGRPGKDPVASTGPSDGTVQVVMSPKSVTVEVMPSEETHRITVSRDGRLMVDGRDLLRWIEEIVGDPA